MKSVYSIVTHRKNQFTIDAAEDWKDFGVCAIGWTSLGDLTSRKKEGLPKEVQNFLAIKPGDILMAYAKKNTIAYVGEAASKLRRTTDNIVGRPESKGGYGYPNQVKVKWWSKPSFFSRDELGPYGKQLGITGKTVTKLDLGHRTFEEFTMFLKSIPSGSQSYRLDEDTIKAGIVKFLNSDLTALEEGLRVRRPERSISKHDRPDFLARDRTGKEVVIECKGTARAADLDQLERYGRSARSARLLLAAYRVEDECKKEAKRNSRFELYECNLKFDKVK